MNQASPVRSYSNGHHSDKTCIDSCDHIPACVSPVFGYQKVQWNMNRTEWHWRQSSNTGILACFIFNTLMRQNWKSMQLHDIVSGFEIQRRTTWRDVCRDLWHVSLCRGGVNETFCGQNALLQVSLKNQGQALRQISHVDEGTGRGKEKIWQKGIRRRKERGGWGAV